MSITFLSVLLTLLSIGMLILTVFRIVELFPNARRQGKQIKKETRKKDSAWSALVTSVSLFFAIAFFRVAAGFLVTDLAKDASGLDYTAEVFRRIFDSLRAFGVDEEYSNLIKEIKEISKVLFPDHHGALSWILSGYATVLSVMAPLVGGAAVLEILSGIFPTIRLYLSTLDPFRKKYYFSELNESSLALAKSIRENESGERSLFIFTDAYVSKEEEREYELLLEARQYGGICVREDLTHVVKPFFGKREYYLMDETELANLRTLMGLLEERNVPYIGSSSIYLFVQGDTYVQVEKQFIKKLKEDPRKMALLGGQNLPTIIPVNGFRNLVHNLFRDVPLYEPLIHRKNENKLSVTILGNGLIGTEAFLSAYWMGQMLVSRRNAKGELEDIVPCDLTVNVVSKESYDAFWSKIDYINPEIRKSVRILGNGEEVREKEDPKLLDDGLGKVNAPYCKVRYLCEDLKDGAFWEKDGSLLESDYYVVALGSDGDNIAIANKLRSAIGKKHLEEYDPQKPIPAQTVIAYALFHPDLTAAMNQEKRYYNCTQEHADIYMHSFGCPEEVYSCRNVYLSQSDLQEQERTMQSARYADNHILEHKIRGDDEDRNYKYWASLARSMHIRYKIFSLGWVHDSLFDGDEKKEQRLLFERYKRMGIFESKVLSKLQKPIAAGEKAEVVSKNLPGEEKIFEELEQQKHFLAWLEHRRWNSFTRAMGYQFTSKHIMNVKLTPSGPKNMPLKLHPCLVEARMPSLSGKNVYGSSEIAELCAAKKAHLREEEITVTEKDVNGKLVETRKKQISTKSRKENLTEKEKLLKKIDPTTLDRLDLLTYQLSEYQTGVEKERLDKELSAAAQGKKAKLEKSKATGFSDYKIYDYNQHEFDRYDDLSKLREKLEGVCPRFSLLEDDVVKDSTISLSVNGAAKKFVWKIAVKKALSKHYVMVNKDDRIFGYLYKDGNRIAPPKGAFEFDEIWFLPRAIVSYRRLLAKSRYFLCKRKILKNVEERL